MSKILLYIITAVVLFAVNDYYIQPSIKKEHKDLPKPIEHRDTKLDHIPKLIPEKYNGK